jgi:membrane-bound metal-dependent hydrolase YbcI (DUF457 family)
MSSPIGHSLVGLALARRLGVRSPAKLLAAVIAANAPDFDIFASMALHRDPWKLHRGATHSYGFTLTAGMLAGAAGVVSAGNIGDDRDLVADGLTGAVIVGSHALLDRLPFPYVKTERGLLGRKIANMSVANWLLDLVVYSAVAYAVWPRGADAAPPPAGPEPATGTF